MSESVVRRRLVARLQALGCLVIPIEPSASNGLDEYPDLIVIGRNGRCAFVETKRPKAKGKSGGTTRPGQRRVLDLLTDRGYYARVHNNESAAAQIAREVGALLC